MIKLIATDMDGTLLNSSREIDKEFYELLDRLEDKNIIIAFASGRNLGSLTKLVPDSMYERIMFISNNGNNIIYKGEQIHSSTISMEDIKIIDKIIENIKGIYRVLCMNNNTLYISSFKNWCIGRLKGYKRTVLKKDFRITFFAYFYQYSSLNTLYNNKSTDLFKRSVLLYFLLLFLSL